MSIGTKMRGVGESTYYTKLLRPQLEEVLNDSDYEMEHILGKRKLVVHTDRISDELNESIISLLEHESPKIIEVERYNHHIEVSWRDINKYAECKTIADMLAINSDYKNDLTSDGEWIYPLPEFIKTEFGDGIFTTALNLRKIKLTLPKATNIGWMFHMSNVWNLEEIDLSAPVATSATHILQSSFLSNVPKLKKCKISLPNITDISQLIWYVGIRSIDLYCPKIKNAWSAFMSTQLDKESTLNFLNQLRPVTWTTDHYVGIGIHVDLKNDEEVLAAIAEVENKGWVFNSLQWNGTPTTQTTTTYDLRKPTIYAKIHTLENGEQHFIWGHYVTNPEDYYEFSSVEEAKEYFGISEEN